MGLEDIFKDAVPRESNAANRTFAREMRDMFLALTAEGFTETQALVIVGEMLRGAMGK